jgi:[histone H3]-lysine79 N-trimethyltransferase
MHLLNEISREAVSGSFGNTQEITSNVDATYGEMLSSSISTILSKLILTPDDLFLDLGSGTGRVVLQVYLEKGVSSCGIEFIEKRHKIAEQSLLDLQSKITQPLVLFIQGDFFTMDWSQATIIFMCNTCFSSDMKERIKNKLRTCKKLRYVIVLREFEPKPDWLTVQDNLFVPSTWNNETSVTIYNANTQKMRHKRTSNHKKRKKSVK